MNYNFFADRNDKLDILEFIFRETDLHIYDLNSKHEELISEYKNIKEIESKFDLENGGKFSVTFQLWSPRHKGQPVFRKVDLNPKYCHGHTFRYATEGWGMIQLYFGGLRNQELNQSHIGHFNEKGALKWEDPNTQNDSVDSWDWKEIKSTSGKLRYYIHNKLVVNKIGSLGILTGANELEKQGIKLR